MSVEKIKAIKEQIAELWEAEAEQIMDARERRSKEANALHRDHRAMLANVEESKRLRAQASALEPKHNRASLEGDEDRQKELRDEYRRLTDEADAAFSRASGALQRLENAGVRGVDLDDLRQVVEGRCAALEAQSPEEIEMAHLVLQEADELLATLKDQSRAFYLARTTGTEQKQARAIELKKAG